MTIHPILRCSLLFLAYSATAEGGRCVSDTVKNGIPVKWYKKKYARRGGLNYAIATTALTLINYN